MAKAKLFLIDGHALCYRSFYAIKVLSTSKGLPTNAIFGFVRMIRSILSDFQPQYMAVCFDSAEKTRREVKFAQYKIQRPKMPDDLRSQIPVIKEIIKAFNIPLFELAGYEADDIIATITHNCVSKDCEVIIASDDKDMYQLAGPNVKYLNSKSGSILNAKDLEDKLGFPPRQIVDFIGLAGDSSDNIPGVSGIGAVNARQLIKSYGSLESILDNAAKITQPKGREKLLIDQKDSAILSKELAVLDVSVPIKCDLATLKVQQPDAQQLHAIFQELEFRKLAEEYSSQEKLAPPNVHVLKGRSSFTDVREDIRKSGRVAILADHGSEEGLFSEGTIFLSVGADKVFSFHVKEITELKEIFESKKTIKITYNIKELLKIFSSHGIEIQDPVFDVMLAGYLLGGSQVSFDLDNLAWHYLKTTIAEDQHTAGEAQVVYRLQEVLDSELKKKSLWPLFEDIEIPLARVLSEVEEHGVAIDTTLLRKLSKECAKKIDALTQDLYAAAGEEFNINSPKQLGKILFEKLKLPAQKRTKTGFSTNESVLTALAQQHAFPSMILEYRQLTKLKSTYIDALPKLINPKSGRIHAQFNQTGTETGRLSSSQPNLQNIPIRTDLGRQIRKAIIAPDKDVFILAADYSQIELRILAHLSGDERLIKAFKDGEDIHTFTASLIFDVREKEVTAQMRNAAKRVNFGIIYGISAFGLANDLKVTQPEAQEFIDRYFERYPKVKTFMEEEIKKCEQNGYVLTILNRRRYIPEITSKNGAVRQFAQRQAINTPVQGSAADLIKMAMINIQKDIKARHLKSRMISTVHDELVFEVPLAEKTVMASLVRDKMEHAVKLKVPIEVSVKAGKNWLDLTAV